MLFATFQDSVGLLLMMVLCLYGGSQFVKKVSGSPVGRTAVTKGAGYLIKQLFK